MIGKKKKTTTTALPSYQKSSSSSTTAYPPPILPTIGNPKWKRTFHSSDIQPILTTTGNSTSTNSNSTNDKASDDNDDHHPSCPICKKHETRYTCPKCSMPFCSVECYKIHDLPLQEKMGVEGGGGGGGGGMCTEQFYRGKVQQVSKLQIKEESNVTKMKDILTRSLNINNNNNNNEENREQIMIRNDDDNNDNEKDKGQLNEDELVELASHVLSIQEFYTLYNHQTNRNDDDGDNIAQNHYSENNDDDDIDATTDFINTIPQQLRIKFEQAVQSGALSHLLYKWYPYWLPQYNNKKNNINNTQYELIKVEEEFYHDRHDMVDDGHNININILSYDLDERIQRIKQQTAITKTLTSSTTETTTNMSQRVVSLEFNICDVLYSTAYILRLYNGCNNHTKAKMDIDTIYVNINTALHLYSKSWVLSKDARYESINEVFMNCSVNNGTSQDTNDKSWIDNTKISDDNIDTTDHIGTRTNNGISRKVLLHDVYNISKYKRMVLRVLFDAIDVLDNGYKCIKKLHKKIQLKQANTDDIVDLDLTQGKRKLKLAIKKVQFYLSWCVLHWDDKICKDVVDNIQSWILDWNLKDDNRINMIETSLSTRECNKEIKPSENILLPFMQSKDSKPLASKDLIVPICTQTK